MSINVDNTDDPPSRDITTLLRVEKDLSVSHYNVTIEF